MKFLLLLLLPIIILPAYAQTDSQTLPTEKGTLDVRISHADIILNENTRLGIDFINPQTQDIQVHIDYTVTVSKDDQAIFGPIPLTHTSEGSVKIPVQFVEEGMHQVYIEIEGILFQPIPTESVMFDLRIGEVQAQPDDDPLVEGGDGGGDCLIATAAYGSELASQVQRLREFRDNTVLGTESGNAFMTAFNSVYYSFSPAVADFERAQPIFKEAVKMTLTPLISSLSLLDHVQIDSEQEMLGYGIMLILLNAGMYIGIPTVAIFKICQLRNSAQA